MGLAPLMDKDILLSEDIEPLGSLTWLPGFEESSAKFLARQRAALKQRTLSNACDHAERPTHRFPISTPAQLNMNVVIPIIRQAR